jgi:hypothetical protein
MESVAATATGPAGVEMLLNKSLERTRDMFIDSNPYVPRPFEPSKKYFSHSLSDGLSTSVVD